MTLIELQAKLKAMQANNKYWYAWIAFLGLAFLALILPR